MKVSLIPLGLSCWNRISLKNNGFITSGKNRLSYLFDMVAVNNNFIKYSINHKFKFWFDKTYLSVGKLKLPQNKFVDCIWLKINDFNIPFIHEQFSSRYKNNNWKRNNDEKNN